MLNAIDLQCNNLKEPLGICGPDYEFSWQCAGKDTLQTAWQIQAVSSPENISGNTILWDSERREDSSHGGHRYGGAPLKSRQRIYWRVRLWDDSGDVSDWSPWAGFEVGLLSAEDWKCEWIGWPCGWGGHALCFQKKFQVEKVPETGRIYLSGSWGEYWLNGNRLGNDAQMQPAHSCYDKSIHVLTFDITAMLRPGENVFAAQVGNGWYGMPVLRYVIEGDGQKLARSHYVELTSVLPSPITKNSIYGGEEYHAQEALNENWLSGAGFEQSRAAFRISGPAGRLRGMELEPVRPLETIVPANWKKLDEKTYSVDFGRNFAGVCRLKVKAPAGTCITMIFSECRYPDGRANQENLLGDRAIDRYIAKGTGAYEYFEPRFTYHGFRFVEISGLTEEFTAETLTGIVLRNDCAKTGYFHSSNQLLNDIFNMVQHTEESNLHNTPTDCPQRTERMGWLNDMMARCETGLFFLNESNVLTKWLRDIADSQDQTTGDVPLTAPVCWGMPVDPVCSSFLETAYFLYCYYGKKSLLTELYGNFEKWIAFLSASCDADGVLRSGGWVGDWVPPLAFNNGADSPRNMTVPPGLVSTALMGYTMLVMAKIAKALGREEDAAKYLAKHYEVSRNFCLAFRKEAGVLKCESQTAYAYALYCGMLPENERQTAAGRLAELFAANHYKHSTGNIGTRFLLEILSQYGFSDMVYQLVSSVDYPGWGYMVRNGATTLWERWELAEGGGMNSHNHPMLGCVGAWLFKHLGGLQYDEKAPGFTAFSLKPYFPPDLNELEISYDSRSGKIISSWHRTAGNTIEWSVQVPAGAFAHVILGNANFELRGGSHRLTLNEKGERI